MAVQDPSLAQTTPAFQVLHAELGRRVRQVFPEAESVTAYDMPAFQVPLADPPAEEDWKGTMPRTHITIAPTEKKAGITLHVWHPKAPYLLRDNEAWLQEAGFKVMVGCLQWNRKADFPLDVLDRLLEAVRKA